MKAAEVRRARPEPDDSKKYLDAIRMMKKYRERGWLYFALTALAVIGMAGGILSVILLTINDGDYHMKMAMSLSAFVCCYCAISWYSEFRKAKRAFYKWADMKESVEVKAYFADNFNLTDLTAITMGRKGEKGDNNGRKEDA